MVRTVIRATCIRRLKSWAKDSSARHNITLPALRTICANHFLISAINPLASVEGQASDLNGSCDLLAQVWQV